MYDKRRFEEDYLSILELCKNYKPDRNKPVMREGMQYRGLFYCANMGTPRGTPPGCRWCDNIDLRPKPKPKRRRFTRDR